MNITKTILTRVTLGPSTIVYFRMFVGSGIRPKDHGRSYLGSFPDKTNNVMNVHD